MQATPTNRAAAIVVWHDQKKKNRQRELSAAGFLVGPIS
jgi:hypothetical protein